jgi:transposase-like protein
MSSRSPYRKHSQQFKLQLCTDIRSGVIRRRDAQLKHNLSNSQMQTWLSQYDRGELMGPEAEAVRAVEYETKIAALERKVGQLTMELELLKKTPRLRLVADSGSSLIVSGPKVARSDEDAK